MLDLLISFLMQNPALVQNGAQQMLRPGVVDPQSLSGSMADFSRSVLRCYHKTARYQDTTFVGRPFNQQGQYGAEYSAVFRIGYSGLSSAPYSMLVAVMARGEKPDVELRTAVLHDTATIPYSQQCVLEGWVKVPS